MQTNPLQSICGAGPKVLLLFLDSETWDLHLLSTEPTRTDVMIHRGWVQPANIGFLMVSAKHFAEHMSKQNPQMIVTSHFNFMCSRQPSVSSLYPFVGSPISWNHRHFSCSIYSVHSNERTFNDWGIIGFDWNGWRYLQHMARKQRNHSFWYLKYVH